ncbi:MAG: FAD-dependent monooxygenase, partial [Pseudomonadota bacterium]
HPHETAQDVTKAENLTKWISEWVDPSKVKVERSAVYQFHGLVAKKWRVGRAMIIGDAAHQMPPFMGQGLCAGARDAANLAWKIAAVSRGEAPLEFLDTVEQERSPHVKAVTKGAIEMGKVVCVLDEDEAAARDRKMMEDHKAGRGFAFPSVPYIENGVLSDATAGHVFPEPFTGSIDTPVRVDDEVGIVPLLVLKDTENLSVADRSAIAALQLASPNLKIVTLGGEIPESIKALDADGHVAHLMDNAPAMLVKPDRIIFGSAAVPVLALAWRNYLQGEDVLVQEKEIAA